jgi:hypothetical protein
MDLGADIKFDGVCSGGHILCTEILISTIIEMIVLNLISLSRIMEAYW